MTSKNQTLELYIEADEDQRLGLFLFHRDLREEFAKIELAEVEAVADEKASNSSRSRLRHHGETLWAMIKVRDFQANGETAQQSD